MKIEWALLLFFSALLVRLAVIVFWRFDGLYGQDAFAYFEQAVAIAKGLPHGQWPPSDFFWPNGYPLLAALLMLRLGQSPLAAQLASLLTGAALAPLAYALCQKLFPAEIGRRAGILAGLSIAAAGQPILSSVSIMSDMAALCWATLAAWLVVRAWHGSSQGWWLFCAGATLALAIITRWIYGLLVPVFAVYVVYQLRQSRGSWWILVLPVLSGASILLPQIWLSLHRPEGLLHSWLLHWHPAHAFQRQFEGVNGYFLYRWPVGLFYALPAGHPAYLFPLLGLAALWGTWRLWQVRSWGPLILLLGWSGTVYLFLAGIPQENFRFGLTLYLPVVLLAGFGLSDLGNYARTRRVAQAIAVVSLAGMLVWAYPMLNKFLTTANHSKAMARQIEQVLPEDVTLLAFGLTLTLQHYTQLQVKEFFYFDATSLDTLINKKSPLYLLLDTDSVENQWRGRPLDRNYRWLRAHTRLTPVSTFPPYTLFEVGRGQ